MSSTLITILAIVSSVLLAGLGFVWHGLSVIKDDIHDVKKRVERIEDILLKKAQAYENGIKHDIVELRERLEEIGKHAS